jgi:epsin
LFRKLLIFSISNKLAKKKKRRNTKNQKMATIRRQMKNMVNNYSEAEVKVREATSNDPWGPSSTLMSEISDLTYNIVALGEVMRMLWKRLNDNGKNWRHVYKSLVLLDYLIKSGNEKVAQQCKEHIVAIQTLKDFQFIEEQKDQGASVREKAKQLVSLLRDDERLKSERNKAFRARERYAQNAMAISSDNKTVYGTTHPNGLSSNEVSLVNSRMPPNPSLTSDIEAVRPSDSIEEDLQVKIAMMLSKQDQEEAEKKNRQDEVKMQIALEQSKYEGQPNKLVDLGDLSPLAKNPSNKSPNNQINDPWSNPVTTTKEPNKTSTASFNDKFNDMDNDDFFTQLKATKPTPSSPRSIASPASSATATHTSRDLIPPLYAATIQAANNDPWTPLPVATTKLISPTINTTVPVLDAYQHLKSIKTNQNSTLTAEAAPLLLNEPWVAKNKNLPNLADPWSATTATTPATAQTFQPSTNNPWSNFSIPPASQVVQAKNDPWSVDVNSISKPYVTKTTSNGNIWPSLTEMKSSNTATLLTNNILNDLWSKAPATTNLSSNNSNNNSNIASAFSSHQMVTTNAAVNNPFLNMNTANSIFPSTNINSTTSNYSALNHPWLITTSNTLTTNGSNKTNNPFID